MIQRIINILYRYPKARLKNVGRFGGLVHYVRLKSAQRKMQEASVLLPPVVSYADGLPIYFLTGDKYLYQTLFCIRSLVKYSSEKFKFIIVDDGSLNNSLLEQINQQLPGAEVITKDQIQQNLNRCIPEHTYPLLAKKRREYPHIRKLTDVHTLPEPGWKLVFDSDMLFYGNPADIITWLKAPHQPIHMVDCMESYGYSINLMAELAKADIPKLLNVGVIGLHSQSINWNKIEEWIKVMEEQEGASYYLEQALTAMLIAGTTSTVLNAEQYVVNPSASANKNQSDILHHYVDLSKKLYYSKAWKKLV